MKYLLIASFLLGVGGCSDEITENYDTLADASGAKARGWIPNFVPYSATSIRSTQNIDTNAQILNFSVPTSDIPQMIEGLRELRERDAALALDLLELANQEDQIQATTIHLTCGENESGGLFVDEIEGRALYLRSSRWDFLCRKRSTQ